MREETDVSLLRIGAELGGRDHSTVLHACDKITREIGRQRRAAPRDRGGPRADLRRLTAAGPTAGGAGRRAVRRSTGARSGNRLPPLLWITAVDSVEKRALGVDKRGRPGRCPGRQTGPRRGRPRPVRTASRRPGRLVHRPSRAVPDRRSPSTTWPGREHRIRAAGSTAVHPIHRMMVMMTLEDRERRPHLPTHGTGRPSPDRDVRRRPPALRIRARPSPSPWSEAHVKLSVMQENLARGLSVVSRAVSTRSTLPVLGQRPPPDRGRRPEADRHEPRDRDHLLGARQDRHGRRDDRAGQAADRPRQLAAGRRAGRPRAPGRRHPAIRAGRFETHVKGIDAEEFPAIPTAGERPTTRISQKVLRQALDETAFAAASDEARPILTGVLCPVRGRPADARRRRQLPDRGQDDPDPRPGRGDERRHPGPLAQRADAASWPTPTTRSTSSCAEHATRSCSTSRASTSSAGSSTASSRTTSRSCRRRTRRAPSSTARSCSGRSGWPRSSPSAVGEHRQAPGRRRRRAGVIVTANAEVGDNEGRVEAAVEGDGTTIAFNARYLADVLPTSSGAVRARAQRAALARRVQAGRRRRVRPRRDAGPDDVLEGPGRSPAAGPARVASPPRPARATRTLDADVRARAAARLGPQRRRQDEPARGDRAARLGPLASDDRPTPSSSAGAPTSPGSGPRRRRIATSGAEPTRSRSPSWRDGTAASASGSG